MALRQILEQGGRIPSGIATRELDVRFSYSGWGVFLQFAFGFFEARACNLDGARLAGGIAFEFAQIGAGESDIGLQCAGLLIDRTLVCAYQLGCSLAGTVFGGVQCLLGTGQAIAQLAEFGFGSAGLFGLLQLGTLHRQFNLGFLQCVVAAGLAGRSRCTWRRLPQLAERLVGHGKLALQTG